MHFQSTLQCCTFTLINAKVCETRASANNFLLHSSDGKTIWNCSELHKSPTPVNKPPQKHSKNLASGKVKRKLCENILEHPQRLQSLLAALFVLWGSLHLKPHPHVDGVAVRLRLIHQGWSIAQQVPLSLCNTASLLFCSDPSWLFHCWLQNWINAT